MEKIMNLRTVAALWKQDVLEMFNRWNEDKPLRTGFPHASNILAPDHSFCMRQLVLAAHYPNECERPPTKPWDTLTNARFKSGWKLHEKYQELFLKYGKVVYFNDNLTTPELDYSHFDDTRLLWFSPDAILEVEGERMVIEIKGYKAETFDKMDESGDPPIDAHKQVNLYLHLLELKHGLILVENKNTQEPKVWCVEYDKELVQPYLDRIYQFKGALLRAENDRGLPKRICSSSRDRNAEKCLCCQVCFKMKG
ncbi:MAG TPA: hypothetical protein VF974_00840 [Patescibacteria group bacterium]